MPQRPHLAMAVTAVLLMLPSLIWGTLPTHSSLHNLTWAEQFASQFGLLDPYPRWMHQSFHGLGAPSFYFYPPLAFWVDGLVHTVTLGLIGTSWRLSVTSVLLLWGSGWAMYRWLLAETGDRRAATIAALAYMAAPYHLTDHYIRGALAEFAAYAPMPLVMLGVALTAQRRRAGVPVIALAYAALVTAHLPTALLISLTAVPAYVLFRAWRSRTDRWFLVRCAAGFGLGLGLAAPYLVPALTLQDHVLIEWMWRYGFQVDQGFVLFPGRWIQPSYMIAILCSIAAGWLLATLSLFASRLPETRLWVAVSLGALLLMSGLVPWIWHVLPISKVGFPWRLLIVVEFAAVTALALGPWPGRERLPRLVLWVAVAAFVPGVVELANGTVGRVDLAVKREVPPTQDAREYLPKGYPQQPDAGYADLNLAPVRRLPQISCEPLARECRGTSKPWGVEISIDSSQPTQVVVRRFAFPSWELWPPLPLGTTEPLRLVSFEAPAGRHEYSLRQRSLPGEHWGWAAGAAALAVLLLAWRLSPDTRTASASP